MVSFLPFPFIFTYSFGIMLTKLNNTILTPDDISTEAASCKCIPLATSLFLWPLGLLAGSSMPCRQLKEKGSLGIWQLARQPQPSLGVLPLSINKQHRTRHLILMMMDQDKTKTPSIVMPEHRQNMNVFWTTELVKITTCPGLTAMTSVSSCLNLALFFPPLKNKCSLPS